MTSPDTLTITQEPKEERTLCPAGPQIVTCVDGISLGYTVEQYQNNPPKLVQKYVFVFQTMEVDPATGRRFELSREFTASMHEKAGMRKFLGTWRGKQYTDEEAKNVELHRVVNQNGLASVEHKTSAAGNVYAFISSMMPPMKGMPRLEAEDYTRAPWWDDRKKEYAAKADAFLQMQNAQSAGRQPAAAGVGADPGFPAALEDDTDDSLPF